MLGGMGIWFRALALTSSTGVQLDGDSACPTVAEIAQRLEEVAPASPTTGAAAPDTVVRVSRVESGLRLELGGAEGQVLATRDLPATEACDDLAAAAAVVIATWLSDLNPQTSPGVELPTPQETPTPPVITARPAPPPAPPRPVFLGVGVLGAAAGSQLALGATVRASVALGPQWLHFGGALGATTSRTADVTNRPDAARWTRGWLGIGPEVYWNREDPVEGHVHGLVGLLHVEGVGVPDPTSDTMLDLGVGGGVSMTHWIGNAAVWLGVDVLAWPGRQRLLVEGAPQDVGSLPRFDIHLAAGVRLGRGR